MPPSRPLFLGHFFHFLLRLSILSSYSTSKTLSIFLRIALSSSMHFNFGHILLLKHKSLCKNHSIYPTFENRGDTYLPKIIIEPSLRFCDYLFPSCKLCESQTYSKWDVLKFIINLFMRISTI